MFHADFPGFTSKIVEHSRYLLAFSPQRDASSLASSLCFPCIDKAMKGIKTVVLVSPGVPVQELNVMHSAKSMGVEQAIKVTNNASPDSPIVRRRWQSEIEAGLLASGLDSTLLRSNAYMYTPESPQTKIL